ncbi:MAG: hypothetical protein V4587_15500 [Acidobacteriota bacterium]
MDALHLQTSAAHTEETKDPMPFDLCPVAVLQAFSLLCRSKAENVGPRIQTFVVGENTLPQPDRAAVSVAVRLYVVFSRPVNVFSSSSKIIATGELLRLSIHTETISDLIRMAARYHAVQKRKCR